MQLATRQSGGAMVVDIAGDITLHNSPQVRKVLLELLRQQKAAHVAVNMTQVPYVDSAGVASLVEGLKASREMSSRLVLYGLSPAAREVLELTKLIQVFEVRETEAEAVSS